MSRKNNRWMHFVGFVFVLAGMSCSSCGGGDDPVEVRIENIEIMDFNPDYEEDPWGEDGQPDLMAVVDVDDEPYFTSSIAMESSLPQRIAFDGLSFQGTDLDKTVVIRIFDSDDDSLDDYVGEVSFVPRELMGDQPIRHTLYGGYLQLDLLLLW